MANLQKRVPLDTNRVATLWSVLARERVTVRKVRGRLYAFGSELACLRLYHAFGGVDAAVNFDDERESWFFAKEA